MWCIKNMDEYRRMVAKGGIYEGIMKAKEEGLIEHISCTTHANSEDIAEIVKDGRIEIEGVTLGYNAINFAYRRAGIQACHAANKAVIVMNPLGGGTIPKHPQRFSFLTENGDEKIAVAALRFLLAHKEITAALPGISTSAELHDAIDATKNVVQIDENYLDNLAKKLSQDLNTLCTCCSYCESCPVEIPITKFMDSYNETLLSTQTSNSGGKNLHAAHDKLNYFWSVPYETANKCIKCGVCENLCTQKLPIIQRLEEIGSHVK
ncbi:MAG: aldo/keto reductase, partial [Defluviitaleaceae bacterium]|nr:aldo/keto reductase [Defluviitaleaceae bacterium]